MTFTSEKLNENIINWVKDNIGNSFEFREHQLEAITNICLNILEDINHTQIIEAPTGSGKSLLNIISAGVLADYYGKTSYILCSDLYLWKQYEDFINKHYSIKKKFGILKGQTGNYICERNKEDMRNADCRMGGVSWQKLFNQQTAIDLGYECASSCPYVKARKKALRSKVVIMTYQLYHFIVNVVAKKDIDNKQSMFGKRDIIFCDECHNIPQIVKNNFTPQIKRSDFTYFKTLHSYRGNIQLDLFDNIDLDEEKKYTLINKTISLSELETYYYDIVDNLLKSPTLSKTDELYIKSYINLLEQFGETVEAIESYLSHKKQVLKQLFTVSDLQLYKACSWFRNCCCFWSDFNMCISEVGIDYIIKEIEENRLLKEPVVKYTCVKEDYIVWKFLIDTAPNRVMMSATIGGYDAFSENIGAKYLEKDFVENEEIIYTVIPSTFNFDKSPVYFLNRYKMSYREKEQSIKSLKPIIYKICSTQYSDKRGMIQTGSYANAKEIYNDAPPEIKRRMLLYNNSKEKTQKITIHQMSKNTILIGPTLVEGIDLPGEQCRFIIILKVPYPVITDEYVKRKAELFPLWYNSVTSNTIIQGIGRGNRFADDYCVTYILDACFLALYNSTKSQYSEELQNRIQIYT